MEKAFNVSIAGAGKAKFLGFAPGRERFAFLYFVIAAGAVASAMTYSGITGLAWWQTVLLLIGSVVVGLAILFSILEVRRLAQTPDQAAKAAEQARNPYTSRIVVVEPPTADPYPHHEDYGQSAGFDQGQLTSHLPDATPFVQEFLRRRPAKKSAVSEGVAQGR